MKTLIIAFDPDSDEAAQTHLDAKLTGVGNGRTPQAVDYKPYMPAQIIFGKRVWFYDIPITVDLQRLGDLIDDFTTQLSDLKYAIIGS